MTAAAATAVQSRRRLPFSDLTRLSTVGLRTRKLRAGLSALGIAIGVAAIVAVLGLSASSQAGLLAEISRLGTNLLTVSNGQSFTGAVAELPTTAPAMIGRISGVGHVQSTGSVSGANAYRSPYVPSPETNGLTVQAASLDLLPVLATTVAQGHYLNAATAREPVAVLGAAAARLLGVDRIYPGQRIWVGGQWSTSPASSDPPSSPPPSTARSSSKTIVFERYCRMESWKPSPMIPEFYGRILFRLVRINTYMRIANKLHRQARFHYGRDLRQKPYSLLRIKIDELPAPTF